MGLYEIWAKCQRHLWAGLVSFLSTDFSSILFVHKFRAIFHSILRLLNGSCFVLDKWVDGAKISHTVQVVRETI